MHKKLIAPIIAGGVLVAGLAVPGIAGAATTTAPSSSQPSAGQLKAWVHAHRKELRKAGLAISAKTIGITPQTLVQDLKAGNSIAGVAQQHDVQPQTVVGALVSAADSRINQAVTAGKLSSTEASKIEAALPGRITKIVDHTF
ncbi:MAG: hypothetical protein JO368_04965 [Acidimicrobiales bacterium]|nr:hypothetical protein [Acidimicrobiales bacterium]